MKNDLIFSEKEKNLIKKNMDLIPDNIFDIHNHIYLKWNIEKELQNILLYNQFSFKDLTETKKILFPWKHIESLVFWQPQKNNELIKNNNEYIKTWVNNKFLLIPQNDNYIEQELTKNTRKWIKVYWFNKNWIINNISYETLEILNNKWLPILIHLPLDIIQNQKELYTLLTKYKNIIFIIAHGWNIQKCKNNYEWYKKAIQILKNFDNIWFDISCINDEKYLKVLTNNFDKERIYYWSDFPISLIKGITLPGKNWEARIISEKYIKWIDNNLSKKIIINLQLDLSNIINIQQTTISMLWKTLSPLELEKIFYQNAKNLNIFS